MVVRCVVETTENGKTNRQNYIVSLVYLFFVLPAGICAVRCTVHLAPSKCTQNFVLINSEQFFVVKTEMPCFHGPPYI